jgi:hypothetical protein
VQIKREAIEHEIKRFMRPDACRYLRPDWRRHWPRGSENDPLYRFYESCERKYRPDQARVPAGSREGGQWMDEGGGGGQEGPQAPTTSDQPARLAGDISGFTKHGINRAISRAVSPAAILDAVTNPLRIIPQEDGKVRYEGRGAVVVLNPAGAVVTVWGR